MKTLVAVAVLTASASLAGGSGESFAHAECLREALYRAVKDTAVIDGLLREDMIPEKRAAEMRQEIRDGFKRDTARCDAKSAHLTKDRF